MIYELWEDWSNIQKSDIKVCTSDYKIKIESIKIALEKIKGLHNYYIKEVKK